MQFYRNIFLVFTIAFCTAINASAQDFIVPITSYSFNNNSIVDERGNSELFLRNNTNLFNDSQRGSVLRFSAASKSYAAINKQLLNTDSCTISFFFFWENSGAGSWHQVFEIHDPRTKSNLFFTPQNGWGKKECSLISDNKEYNLYEAISARQLPKNTWMHIAVTFSGKLATTYIDGIEASQGYLMFSPKSLQTDSLYLGGNPHRSDNYYISARLDDIKIFDKALSANQVAAVFNGTEIPAPENAATDWETTGDPLALTIDISEKHQTIQNFGASDAWNTERIGKYWPEAKKEKLAELLFSREKDAEGNPKGIGLSAWRFNIGAGTSEQGSASRISVESRRTEGFLNADGTTYNWNKQQGQQWFLRKAVNQYNIHHVIGWQNSPPVAFTQNNLGFREYNAPWATILKQEHFDDYARFLGYVVEHFKNEGIHFDYISPVNEPQWGWAPSSNGGTVTQEGTPWTNQEIYDVVDAIDAEFSTRSIKSKIFITEAGAISRMVGGSGHADNQLNKFWNKNSSLSLLDKPSFSNIVSYHSYFQDSGSELISDRADLFNKSQLLEAKPELWQTEYSLLGDGYRYGYPSSHSLSEMESALSLAKVIIADLNISNTTAWQWWTTFEKGKHDGETRFCLIEAFTKSDNSDGDYHLNKLFYSFGNFSHFIRPGMTRIGYSRSDNLTATQETTDVMFSAYINAEENKLVLIAANFTNNARKTSVLLENASGKVLSNQSLFLTDEFSNLTKQKIDLSSGKLIVPAHSVITYTADLTIGTSNSEQIKESNFKAWFDAPQHQIITTFDTDNVPKEIRLYNISGNLVSICPVKKGQAKLVLQASGLQAGVYFVSAFTDKAKESKKVLVTSY